MGSSRRRLAPPSRARARWRRCDGARSTPRRAARPRIGPSCKSKLHLCGRRARAGPDPDPLPTTPATPRRAARSAPAPSDEAPAASDGGMCAVRKPLIQGVESGGRDIFHPAGTAFSSARCSPHRSRFIVSRAAGDAPGYADAPPAPGVERSGTRTPAYPRGSASGASARKPAAHVPPTDRTLSFPGDLGIIVGASAFSRRAFAVARRERRTRVVMKVNVSEPPTPARTAARIRYGSGAPRISPIPR